MSTTFRIFLGLIGVVIFVTAAMADFTANNALMTLVGTVAGMAVALALVGGAA